MTTGLLLGLLSLYYLHFAPRLPTPSCTSIHLERHNHNLNLSLLFLHLYYIPSLSGILYPGAAWEDPEFGASRKQLWAFSGIISLAWGAWWMERGVLGGEDGREKMG